MAQSNQKNAESELPKPEHAPSVAPPPKTKESFWGNIRRNKSLDSTATTYSKKR